MKKEGPWVLSRSMICVVLSLRDHSSRLEADRCARKPFFDNSLEGVDQLKQADLQHGFFALELRLELRCELSSEDVPFQDFPVREILGRFLELEVLEQGAGDFHSRIFRLFVLPAPGGASWI